MSIHYYLDELVGDLIRKPLSNSPSKSNFCIIVDGFSSGSLFIKEFLKLGLKCIHVQSNPNLKLVDKAFESKDYVENFIFNGDIEKLVNKLKYYSPLFVMPGFHTSVYLAEELGTRLKVPSNKSMKTAYRMDKFLMHQRLSECGLNNAKGFLIQNKDELVQKYRSEFPSQPVILKPSNSAGTDKVFLCKNESELINSFSQIIGGENALSLLNQNVLIQEYLEGTEYIVNTITIDNKHITTDIWLSKKIDFKGTNFLYDKTILLESQGFIQNELCNYNNKVLDALEFQFGSCHNELMYTSKGPVLIEMNPRISGGNLPVMALECTGMGQIGWTNILVKNILEPQAIEYCPYQLHKNALSITLNSKKQGVVKGFKNIESLQKLPSMYQLTLRTKIGDRLNITTDVWNSPGIVHLIHKDLALLEADYLRVREIEEEGLFLLEN